MQPIKNKKRRLALSGRSHGFTLIEIMVAVAIVGILATIAYPSYESSIRKAKRAEGRSALMQLMQQQERYYSQHATYLEFSSASTDVNEKKFKWFSGESARTSAYEMSANACANETLASCVKLSAKPGTAKVNASYIDTECGSLTFTSAGVKSADARNCW